jgi:hypothetical protein
MADTEPTIRVTVEGLQTAVLIIAQHVDAHVPGLSKRLREAAIRVAEDKGSIDGTSDTLSFLAACLEVSSSKGR